MKKLNELDLKIIDFVKSQNGARVPFEVLAAALEMETAADQKRLKKYVIRLVASKYLKRTQSGLLEIPPDKQEPHLIPEDTRPKKGKPAKMTAESNASGSLSMNRYGVGFVRLPGMEEDVRIPQKYLGTALPGDIVEVQPFNKRGKDRIEGKITRIVSRADRSYVGDLVKQAKNHFFIETDPQSAPVEFIVKEEDLNGAKPGEKVVFRLVQWEYKGGLPQARIVESLGKTGSNDAEVLAVLATNQLKNAFPDDVEKIAAKIPRTISEGVAEKRKDLRQETVFTIDPFDAKDFDDALNIRKLDNGNWHLGVHIADVTHYVTRGNALDEEAISRATSVYLVDRVIPMLPEVLSNGVCSLVPNEDRLTFSCFMEVTPEGQVIDYEIAESIIHSKRRYTYEEVQAVIEGKDDPFKEHIDMLSEMTQMLTAKRMQEGAVDFDSPEPRFRLDEKGFPIEVVIKERLLSHRLVEECMLLANKTVAEHVDHLRAKKRKSPKDAYPFLYRIHDNPDPEKLANVAELVGPLGIRVKMGANKVSVNQIKELLEQVKGTTLERIVNELVLRSMAKAVYSPDNIGHFGLHFDHYTHFTSPIRRYPDVIVHRLLKSYAKSKHLYSYEELQDLGRHCSEQEKSAQTAERDSVKIKQVEYLSKRIGEVYDGVISGVTDFGVFVVLDDIYCEGMIRMGELNDDYYVYDQRRHQLTGRRRGRSYRLGDPIKIRVESVSVEQKTIEFSPVNSRK